MGRKRLRPVTIAGIEFDALLDETKNLAATIPVYPVESGFPVSDTIILEPLSARELWRQSKKDLRQDRKPLDEQRTGKDCHYRHNLQRYGNHQPYHQKIQRNRIRQRNCLISAESPCHAAGNHRDTWIYFKIREDVSQRGDSLRLRFICSVRLWRRGQLRSRWER